MAVNAWQSGQNYNVGDVVRSNVRVDTGLFFKCAVGGQSGSSQPAWPSSIGETVTDGSGSLTWISISGVYEDVSGLAPDAIIELWELELNPSLHGSGSVYRWHNGCNAGVTGNIMFGGTNDAASTYVRLPIEVTGFKYSSTGSLPRPVLTISNLNGYITLLLAEVNDPDAGGTTGNDLGGAEVRRIRTLKKFLDGESTADPEARWPTEIYFVDRKASENRDIVSFELASKIDLPGMRIPRRHIIANTCQWVYKGDGCGYNQAVYFDENDESVGTAAADKCGKRLSSCAARFGSTFKLPFGSFPTAGNLQ